MRAEGDSNTSNGTSRPFSNGSGPSPLHKAAMSNSANGTRRSSVAMNGSSSTNGHSNSGVKPRPPYFGHDREEVTRILIQALTDLGYDTAASSLSQESGYNLESPTVAKFRNAVLQGDWAQAENLLFGDTLEEGGVSIGGNGLVLRDGVDRNLMRFGLRQQKFLELLEQRDTGKALMVLRQELTPLYQDTSKLHFLSSLLMCQSTEDLKVKAEWDGAGGESRHHLLSELSKCISPSVMLPEHRLAILLQQVKRHQISNCLYHNTASSPSLYQDHNCDRNHFPVHPVLDLDKHTGEVWNVKFSNDGSRLASCGKDGTCVIYEVGSFDVLQCLAMPETGVGSVAWSPDDSMIVTCQVDKFAILWDVNTGKPIVKLPRFGEPVGACVWAPDGRSFVTGVLDKERNLCQWNTRGELIFDWGQTHRIQDLAVSPNGRHLVAMTNETMIYVYNFMTRDLEYDLDMEGKMGSVSISQNGRYLLVNKLDGEARMLDLETRETVRVFRNDEQGGNWLIRAAYGGANESFVIIGSESGNINIWHKESGTLVEKLQHGKTSCNAISWSPTDPSMFASAGDDGKVRMSVLPNSTFPPK
ncbi:WD domain-containing protein [Acephala macrosclerotiorum]|nr:WD domain-containing protein [Acephala macrosclerotiorum]